jgi:hypothetical protein
VRDGRVVVLEGVHASNAHRRKAVVKEAMLLAQQKRFFCELFEGLAVVPGLMA